MANFAILILFWAATTASAFQPGRPTPVSSAGKSALKPLAIPTIERAIDEALSPEKEVPSMLKQSKGLRLQRIMDWKSTLERTDDGTDATEFLSTKTPWYFGMAIVDAETEQTVGIFSFYVAYSSWNGRILYVDRMECDHDTEELLLRILAQIAIDLDCARVTWRVSSRMFFTSNAPGDHLILALFFLQQHESTPDWHVGGTNPPEMHPEVLTLSMDEKAMSNYLSDTPLSSLPPLEGDFSKELVESAVSSCLDELETGPFRLRLAKKEDLETVTRLSSEISPRSIAWKAT